MPAKSERQRRFFGAELARLQAGEKTHTGMSEEKMKHYTRKKKARRLKDLT